MKAEVYSTVLVGGIEPRFENKAELEAFLFREKARHDHIADLESTITDLERRLKAAEEERDEAQARYCNLRPGHEGEHKSVFRPRFTLGPFCKEPVNGAAARYESRLQVAEARAEKAEAELAALKEPDIESLAAAVHQSYLDECERLGWPVKAENAGSYEGLTEASKDLDRATVRAVLAALTLKEAGHES